jgi:hypothetical protein
MPFQLSPGVAVVEKDFSSIVPAVSSSAGAFAGPFAWGPVEDPVRVSSETDLVSRFGSPTDSNYQSFFTAANFLSYTNNMLIVRSDATGLRNAVSLQSGGVTSVTLVSAGSGYVKTGGAGGAGEIPAVTFSAPNVPGGVAPTAHVTYTDAASPSTTRTITGVVIDTPGTGYTSAPTVTIAAPASGAAATAQSAITVGGLKIKNIATYLNSFNTGEATHGTWAAKFPGSKGNGLRVVMLDAGNWSSASTSIKNLFQGAPGTSAYAAQSGVRNDEVHIVIYDNARGDFSGLSGTVLEKYSYLSKLSDAKNSDGSNNYYKSVINSSSRYIWWLDHTSVLSEPATNRVTASIGVSGTLSPVSGETGVLGKIEINDQDGKDDLANFKAWFDSATDKIERKITIAGSVNNNKTVTIASITAVYDTSSPPNATFTIKTVESLSSESVTNLQLTSVPKPTWGQTRLAIASNVYSSLAVMQPVSDQILSGGVDDFASSDGNIISAYSLLVNAEQYDVSLVPLGNVSPSTAQSIVSVLENRRDCMMFISPRNNDGSPITSIGSDATTAILNYKTSTNINSSYAVIDSGSKYQYDRYNDSYRWVPLNGDIAGLCARTDYTADPWFSPGGFNRGQVKNIVKLGFNPNQSDRDVLYQNGINPVTSFPGQGTILYGDKTMLARPSAFDRINVRRLFIVLEKSIAVAARYQMFEFNDSFTRAQFKNLVEPFLRDVQGRRGVVDFRVKCDESNNTGEVIDRNEFVADIFIKPNRSINFITLNFIAARSSVSFDEIGG